MSTITVSELKKYFEERISDLEQKHQYGGANHKDPKCPMIVFFIENNSLEAIHDVAMHLYDFWPSYYNEILFIGVKEGESGIEYSELVFGDDMQYKVIEAEEVQKKISGLFGERSPFEDKSQLFVYNVIDTTSFNDEEDFKRSTKTRDDAQHMLIDESVHVVDMLIVLLNEQMGKNLRIAKKIKNVLSDMADQNSSTLIISNKRDDNITMESWDLCYKLISDTIAITNNDNSSIALEMYKNKIYAAAYACEEKPVGMIAQTVIKRLIDRLSTETFGNLNKIQQKDRTEMYKGLGINEDGRFELLNIYAEERIFNLLPVAEELQLFPRTEIRREDDMQYWGENDFNNYTLNSWNCYIERFLKEAKETIRKESTEKFQNLYLEEIANNFSVTEWIWIGEHIDEIKKTVMDISEPTGAKPVLEEAKDRIRYVIATETDLTNILIGAIINKSNEATEFLREWNKFLKSVINTHDGKDETINKFYGKIIQDFFDRYDKDISDMFRDISNMDMLRECIFKIIKMLVDSSEVFSASFEKELELRLQEEALPTNAKEYILKKLSNLPVFYSAAYSLSSPVVSSVLVKTETSLYDELVTHLPQSVYYYDTGNSNFVEALRYAEIPSYELKKEEE